MKLVISVVQDTDAGVLIERLMEAGHSATKLASTGGFLREGNTTVLIGVEEEKLEEVLDIIRKTCKGRRQLVTPMGSVGRSVSTFIPRPVEVPVGGATIFVVDVERFEKV